MGVIYVVVPLDAEVAAWLDGEAILHPSASDRATMPSPREILEVLDMLGGLRIDVNRNEANAQSVSTSLKLGASDLRLSDFPNALGMTSPAGLHSQKGRRT